MIASFSIITNIPSTFDNADLSSAAMRQQSEREIRYYNVQIAAITFLLVFFFSSFSFDQNCVTFLMLTLRTSGTFYQDGR